LTFSNSSSGVTSLDCIAGQDERRGLDRRGQATPALANRR
jgi:hypothetical protein